MKLLLALVSLLALAPVTRAQTVEAIPPTVLRAFYVSSNKPEAQQLKTPSAMAVAPSGSVYVLDRGYARIVQLDTRGKFVREFGEAEIGLGRGLEMRLGAVIRLDSRERVFIGDPAQARVLIFRPDGTLERKFTLPIGISHMDVSKAGEIYVTEAGGASERLVHVFNEKGKLLRSFGDKLVRVRGTFAWTTNGALVAVADDGSVNVAFKHWLLFRRYSAQGRLESEQ